MFSTNGLSELARLHLLAYPNKPGQVSLRHRSTGVPHRTFPSLAGPPAVGMGRSHLGPLLDVPLNPHNAAPVRRSEPHGVTGMDAFPRSADQTFYLTTGAFLTVLTLTRFRVT